jgi:hypothetical protein
MPSLNLDRNVSCSVSSASLSIEWRTLELSIEDTLEDCSLLHVVLQTSF